MTVSCNMMWRREGRRGGGLAVHSAAECVELKNTSG